MFFLVVSGAIIEGKMHAANRQFSASCCQFFEPRQVGLPQVLAAAVIEIGQKKAP